MMRAKAGAFTLIELLVVVAILAVLIAILLPSLARARQQAMQVKCAANLKGLGLGMLHYVNDQNGYLPELWRGEGFWAAQLVPYVKIRRSKVGSRNGLLRCPADENPPYMYLTGSQAGHVASEGEKIAADSGRLPTQHTTRRRGRGGSNAGQLLRSIGPLIEPLTYGPSIDNFFVETGSGDWHRGARKLAGLDRPYCQILLSEAYNYHHYAFDWHYWLDDHADYGEPGIDEREGWRHYGGRDPNRNGTNWLFADGHVRWHSVNSLKQLFCCQDFPRGISLHEDQAQRCSGDAGRSGSGGGARTRQR